jgi:hypothetical protein
MLKMEVTWGTPPLLFIYMKISYISDLSGCCSSLSGDNPTLFTAIPNLLTTQKGSRLYLSSYGGNGITVPCSIVK